jgi:hypothetical protein
MGLASYLMLESVTSETFMRSVELPARVIRRTGNHGKKYKRVPGTFLCTGLLGKLALFCHVYFIRKQ